MNVYLKSKNNENKILVKYILLLIPFLIYGFYKNGILLYKEKELVGIIKEFNSLSDLTDQICKIYQKI